MPRPRPAAAPIKVQEDETVEVGVELAVIGEAGEDGGSVGRRERRRRGPAEAAAEPEPEPERRAAARAGAASRGGAGARAGTASRSPRPPPSRQARPAARTGAHAGAGAPPPAQAAELRPPPAASRGGRADESPATTTTRSPARTSPRWSASSPSEHGVDLATVDGTGVGGRIRKQDVLAAARARPPSSRPRPEPAARSRPHRRPRPSRRPPRTGPGQASRAPAAALRGTLEKMSRLRQVIATRMVESLQTSAQLTTVVEVDVTKIARLRERAKADFEAREGVKLIFLPFFAVAAIEALKVHPVRQRRRSTPRQKTITYHDAEHLGIAVDTERGLMVPVIHDAGDLNLGGLARKIADLAERTRSNKVSPDELGGGTFTLTNTGSRGALFDTPIINQPQVGHPRHRRRSSSGRLSSSDPNSARRSRCARWSTSRCPTTTASSTAPTPRGSSPPSRSGSRPATSSARWG